jgi:hypothetical protein
VVENKSGSKCARTAKGTSGNNHSKAKCKSSRYILRTLCTVSLSHYVTKEGPAFFHFRFGVDLEP